jgi:hypothetical protein
MKKFLLMALMCMFGLVACVPVNQKVEYKFLPLTESIGLELVKPFKEQLKNLEIQLGSGIAYQYDGSDSRAFLAVVDRFYQEHPNFCPVSENGFLYLEKQPGLFMTLAAPLEPRAGNPVIALVYDQTFKPKLTFVSLKGSSRKVLAVNKCLNPAR